MRSESISVSRFDIIMRIRIFCYVRRAVFLEHCIPKLAYVVKGIECIVGHYFTGDIVGTKHVESERLEMLLNISLPSCGAVMLEFVESHESGIGVISEEIIVPFLGRFGKRIACLFLSK